MAVTRKSLITKFPGKAKSTAKIIHNNKHILIDTQELHCQIAKKAYELYEKRGRGHGLDKVDWFQAQHLIILECEQGVF